MRSKASRKKPDRKKNVTLAYDLGGTKVAVGVVSWDGKILEETRVPVEFEKGKTAVFEQLSRLGKAFLKQYPEIRGVGIASAGPLDSQKGLLLDPTNMFSDGKSWGVVPICSILKKKLGRPIYLDNDAAAAVLAERWKGAAKGKDNVIILTLGTGVGIGAICNGELVRAGRGLHPEGSHIIIGRGDTTARCGCGNLGCIEAYLSGKNFGLRASRVFMGQAHSALEIAELARSGHPAALAAFKEYAELMAVALASLVVLYAPERVIFTGSFAATNDLFLKQAEAELERLLSRRRSKMDLMPVFKISPLKNQAGLLGGAVVAFQAQGLQPGLKRP